MTGISILIVDDDKLLVEKLEKTVDWERLNISTVFTAYNIRQARSLMEEYPVHILLCDIDMPQGNGLELLEWVRAKELDIECMFLSSYANFAYAQMAVRLSAREYLLKPISTMELERVLGRIVGIVQKKRKAEDVQISSPRIKMWENLLLRRVPEDICISEAVEKKICRSEEHFSLVLVRILESAISETEKKDIAIFDFVIRNITAEFFQVGGVSNETLLEAVVHISDLEWMLALRAESDIRERVKEVTVHLKKGIGRQMGIYLGSPTAFAEIGRSRARLENMEQHAVLDEDEVLYEGSWEFAKKRYTAPPWEIWEKEMLQTDGVERIREKLLQYIEEQRQQGGWHKNTLSSFLRELVQLLYKYLNDRKYSYAQIFDDSEFASYEKTAKASVVGLREFVRYIFGKLERNGGETNQEDVVYQIRDFIEQHLGENITRATLAQEVFLSEGYLSKIFLKETGISLPNYIAERRIEKAREYLENSTLPVSRIATEVGYNNFSYFSKTFRELTGCTPNEYRMRINKKEH
ncbi:MAG: response regulator transcription factor [Marvinbryantia sp.]